MSTQGPAVHEPVTNRLVFTIAGPAMVANLTTPLLGIVSMAAIGRLGNATALGGVAMASVGFTFVFWLFGFLRMGTIGFTAQAQGAGDAAEIRAVFARGLLMAGVLGFALIALQWPITALLFSLLGGSEAASAAAKLYFQIRLWSSPIVLANYVVLGWLIGQARTGRALAVHAAIDVINIAVTVLLVIVLGWGIAGAAIAPIVAEAAGLAIGLAIALRLAGGSLRVPRALLLQRERFVRMISVNRDIMIRTAALLAGFLFFTSQGARNGDVALAANAVLYNFISISAFFLDGISAAGSQIGGRTTGARDREGFVRATTLVMIWSALFAVATSLLFAVAGTPLIDLITTNEEVRSAARLTMWLAILAPVAGFAAYAFDGVFIGATWARDMRNLMLIAFAIYIATWWLLRPLGNDGLWIALLAFLFVRGVLQAWRYPALLRMTFGERATSAAILPR